jgi:hypothetical protein
MRKLRAFSCTRVTGGTKSATAVCFLLDEAHARHTLRVFAREHGRGAELRLITEAEAWRLLAAEDAESDPADEDRVR